LREPVRGERQVQAVLLSDLADDDAVGMHPRRLLDETAQLDVANALQVGPTSLHGPDVWKWDREPKPTVVT